MKHALNWLVPLALLAFSPAALGASDAQGSLKQTLKALEESKEKQGELEKDRARNAKELDALQTHNISLADDIRTVERRVAEKTAALQTVESELKGKQKSLDARQGEIASLLYGMIRMQRLPRQFVIAHPGNADDLLRTASGLKIAYGAAGEAMQTLKGDMEQLAALKADTAGKQRELEEEKAGLATKMANLQAAMKERQVSQRKLDHDHQITEKRIAALSQESNSLQELVERLDREQALFRALGGPKEKPEAPGRASKESPRKTQEKEFSEEKGRLPYPASGGLIHRFGDKKGAGDRYNGHVLRTNAGAMVAAPHSGRVVFSGTFMDYGNMVILQHDNDFHTVMAGLDTIRVEPGQEVEMGEPIGVMGNTLASRELYLELRKHSKAIDPAAWMGNLSGEVTAQR